MKQFTQKQIDTWKRQYGRLYKVSADGKTAILFDPFTDLRICKMAYEAMDQSFHKYVEAIINNCFLAGDEYIKSDKALLGITEQIMEISEMPEPTVVPHEDSDYFTITCEGQSVKVRKANRQDIILAESKNPKREAFETNIALLEIIGNKDEAGDVRKNSERAYIGILAGIEQLKEKATIRVEKL